MTDRANAIADPAQATDMAEGAACRETGQFVASGGCYALRIDEGVDVWLDICPVPLHMIDQRVEIAGRRFGSHHILVEAIGPVGAFS